jgi:hypothetical protein
MPEPILSLWHETKAIFMLFCGILGLSGWVAKRQINRIDTLEKNSISRREHNDTTKSFRQDVKDLHAKIESGRSETTKRLDRIIELMK